MKLLIPLLCLVLLGCTPSPPGKICTKKKITRVWKPERDYLFPLVVGRAIIPTPMHEDGHWEIKCEECIEWKDDPSYKKKY